MNISFTIPDDIEAFMLAQRAAEEQGEREFTCPICGEVAFWVRAPLNNHLHCHCSGCGMGMME